MSDPRSLGEIDADIITVATQIRDSSSVRDHSTMIYPTLLFQRLNLLLREEQTAFDAFKEAQKAQAEQAAGESDATG